MVLKERERHMSCGMKLYIQFYFMVYPIMVFERTYYYLGFCFVHWPKKREILFAVRGRLFHRSSLFEVGVAL